MQKSMKEYIQDLIPKMLLPLFYSSTHTNTLKKFNYTLKKKK